MHDEDELRARSPRGRHARPDFADYPVPDDAILLTEGRMRIYQMVEGEIGFNVAWDDKWPTNMTMLIGVLDRYKNQLIDRLCYGYGDAPDDDEEEDGESE